MANNCNHDWERIHPIKVETMIQNLTTKYPNQREYIRYYVDANLIVDPICISVCLICGEIDNKPKKIYSEIIPILDALDKRRELALSIYEKHKEVCDG